VQYGLPVQRARLLYEDLQSSEIKRSVVRDSDNFQIITMLDPHYPSVLKTIPDPPLVLYTIGNLTLLKSKPALSVVGTRQPSREAKDKTSYLLRPLIHADWTIVSGMARGVDSFAHSFTLSEHGKTIAVLGSGFYHIYPKQNIQLFNAISKTGLVLSEYSPGIPPARFRFPERNRIISGLSFGTLVIEATEKSGTLITVDQALDQGREVYAVPGSPLLSQTKGCHRLIQDGAKLVTSAEDLMDDWKSNRYHIF
jgi:DNA processing protein